MNKELESLLKVEMGYVKNQNKSCETCVNGKEIEDTFQDRAWDFICDFNSVGSFLTTKKSVCLKYCKAE